MEIVALFSGLGGGCAEKKLCYNCGRMKRLFGLRRMMFFFPRMLAGWDGWIVRALCAGCLAALLSAAGEAVAQEADRCGVQGGGLGYSLGNLCVARTGNDFGPTHHQLCEGFGGTRQTVYAEGAEAPDSELPAAAQNFITESFITERHPTSGADCKVMTPSMRDAVRAWALSDPDYHTHLTEHFSSENFVNCLDSSASSLGSGSGLHSPKGQCNFDAEAGVFRMGRDRFDCLMTRFVPQIEWTSPEWCLNLDQSGTVCVLGSPDFFPCRGLLKHLRICNLVYNRPAVNPFICAPRCQPGERARGAGCHPQ